VVKALNSDGVCPFCQQTYQKVCKVLKSFVDCKLNQTGGSMSKLIEELLEVQKELSHAKAEAVNPHFKSSYVKFEDLWDYAKEALNARDIMIQQVSHECELGACIETVLYGHGENLSTGKMIVRADKPTAQAFGSAVTYAKRYSLSMALGIGADKDDDANNATSGAKRGW
jgi:hypothetical protein